MIKPFLIQPEFAKRIDTLKKQFFSRDPKLWPIYNDPGFLKIIEEKRKNIHSLTARIKGYKNGDILNNQLHSGSWLNTKGIPAGQPDELLLFSAAMTKNWDDPASAENVVTRSSDPGVYGAAMAAMVNPNLVYDEYSGMGLILEKAVIREMAQLVGYDPHIAGGLFTQGGTFCNMYGYLFGIRKSLPRSVFCGLESTDDYRFISSQGGHYSNTTTLSVLGVNIEKKSIRIRMTEENKMDLADFEEQLRACFLLGCKVPTIMLTMGTTDTFGIDRVKAVRDIIDKLRACYQIEQEPHIHVDSAVGWPMIFFLDYDFKNNPLSINERVLEGLARHVESFRELKYADSFTIDFQKWGFTPYTSSLVMVKNAESFKYLEHDPENFSYFESDTQGYSHLQSTIECSRGAGGVFSAFCTLRYLGKEGFQTLIAHGLQNAEYFRFRLQEQKGVALVAQSNCGPSVGFRLYDPALVSDPIAEFGYETTLINTPEYEARLARNNAYHRAVFLQRGKKHLYTNWVEFIAHTDYNEYGQYRRLPGEKAVFFNPSTDLERIDLFIKNLRG